MCPGNVLIRVTPPISAKPSIPVRPPIPLWQKGLALAGVLLVLYLVVIVPLVLRPLRLPHRDASVKTTTTHDLRPLALKHRWNWLWPRNAVTVGTRGEDDIKLAAIGSLPASETLARIRRSFATKRYQLIALQKGTTSQVSSSTDRQGQQERVLTPLPAKQPVGLREGDEFEIGGQCMIWRQPGSQRKAGPT